MKQSCSKWVSVFQTHNRSDAQTIFEVLKAQKASVLIESKVEDAQVDPSIVSHVVCVDKEDIPRVDFLWGVKRTRK